MPGPSLRVTDQTSIKNLQEFAAQAGDGAKIRGKKNGDGSITLYASTKEGRGIKNFLFGTTAKRRANAQSAITQILYANTKRIDRTHVGGHSGLDDAITGIMGFMPKSGDELKGKGLKEISGFAADAWQDAFRPHGMNVGAHGAITGAVTLTTGKDDATGEVKPTLTLFRDCATKQLGKTKVVGGVEISHKSHDDMTRMDCSIGAGYNTFGPPGGDGTPAMNQKKIDNAQRLLQFAGTPNAAKVLSSVVHQYMLRPMETSLQTPSGENLRLMLANRGNTNDYTHKDSNGVSHNVGKPGQYNEAVYQLDTYTDGTGDFKVTVNWDLYATGFQSADRTDKQPLSTPHQDRVIKTTTTVEFRISKADADRGVLNLTTPVPPMTVFDGHLY